MRHTRVALLAGGMGVRMRRLGHNRLKPLIPFGACCHLIDFSLCNAHKSGAPEVLLMAQHNELQLVRYLLDTWCRFANFGIHFGPYNDIDRNNIEASFAGVSREQERGTADALIKNMPYIASDGYREVMVLHADHVYRFDYQPMIDFHRASRAALTMGYQQIDLEYVKLFGMADFDARGNLRAFTEKPVNPHSNTIFSAVCIFDIGILCRYLTELQKTNWQYDISRDVIPAMLANGEKIVGYEFCDYWEDLGTVQRYYLANMRLLDEQPSMRLSEMPQTIAPAVGRRHVAREGNWSNVIVGDDLRTSARLEHSIIFPGAQVADSALIRNCVLLPGSIVGENAILDGAIVLEGQAGLDSRGEDIMQVGLF
jgi:valienol-1-phosphate guanylyltransferase